MGWGEQLGCCPTGCRGMGFVRTLAAGPQGCSWDPTAVFRGYHDGNGLDKNLVLIFSPRRIPSLVEGPHDLLLMLEVARIEADVHNGAV
jgi:hypothetical protein